MKQTFYLFACVISYILLMSCSNDESSGTDLSSNSPEEIIVEIANTQWQVKYEISSKSSNEKDSWTESWVFQGNGTFIAQGNEDGEEYVDYYSYRFVQQDDALKFIMDRDNVYEVTMITSSKFIFRYENKYEIETITGHRKFQK